jgi:hypothetical protein
MRDKTRKSADITQIFLCRAENEQVVLKIDLVNDIATHFGGWEEDETLGKVDGIRNILSNKISCVYRFEPKDIADLWTIARNHRFSWKEIIGEAQQKDAGIDPIIIADIIGSFPPSHLESIRWRVAPDSDEVIQDLHSMVGDIIGGGNNSLVEKR